MLWKLWLDSPILNITRVIEPRWTKSRFGKSSNIEHLREFAILLRNAIKSHETSFIYLSSIIT